MNKAIVHKWNRLVLDSGGIIRISFEKTDLVALKPPAIISFGAFACVSSTQCGSGEKASELELAKENFFLRPH